MCLHELHSLQKSQALGEKVVNGVVELQKQQVESSGVMVIHWNNVHLLFTICNNKLSYIVTHGCQSQLACTTGSICSRPCAIGEFQVKHIDGEAY